MNTLTDKKGRKRSQRIGRRKDGINKLSNKTDKKGMYMYAHREFKNHTDSVIL